MFTGIIEAVGTIKQSSRINGDLRLHIDTNKLDLADVKLGDSIATNGVCLTVVELSGHGFWADVSRETLAYTRLGELAVGSQVNLEKALMPTSRLGGHLVSGHVDGVVHVVNRAEDARSIRLTLAAPANLTKYLAHKGSVCIDGISLTINSVSEVDFNLNIVPHTAQETTIANWQAGSQLHIEVDVIARYLERLLSGDKVTDRYTDTERSVSSKSGSSSSGLTLETLAASGLLEPR